MISALKYTRKLEEVGFSREQAETHIQIMTEIVEADLATKQDIAILRQEINILKEYLENKIIQSEYRMTIKMGTMLTVAVGVLAAIEKFL